ncbi:MAG: vitamin K epoxide reductase family protein [Gemmatimonadota bacterium]
MHLWHWAARLLALIGFLDAAYLTATHLAGGSLACGASGGCDVVTTSRFATVGGVPIAAFGLVYYSAVSLVAWTPPEAWTRKHARILLALTGTALGVSAFLVYLQAAVLEAWCRYCLVSAAMTVGLVICAVALFRGHRPDPAGFPTD